MRSTNEPPTESGWYWFEGEDAPVSHFSGIVYVAVLKNVTYQAYTGAEGDDELGGDSVRGVWTGPIRHEDVMRMAGGET